MRKTTHAIEKLPNNRTKISAIWNNQMRVPHNLTITREKLPVGINLAPVPMIEGDSAEVYHLFEGLAEMAWEMGWRPAGLGPVLAAIVKEYKLPKA